MRSEERDQDGLDEQKAKETATGEKAPDPERQRREATFTRRGLLQTGWTAPIILAASLKDIPGRVGSPPPRHRDRPARHRDRPARHRDRTGRNGHVDRTRPHQDVTRPHLDVIRASSGGQP